MGKPEEEGKPQSWRWERYFEVCGLFLAFIGELFDVLGDVGKGARDEVERDGDAPENRQQDDDKDEPNEDEEDADAGVHYARSLPDGARMARKPVAWVKLRQKSWQAWAAPIPGWKRA
jgi:hypothetical protein